jgi:phasin
MRGRAGSQANRRDRENPMTDFETPRKATKSASAPKFDMPKFDPSKFEMPEMLREMAEKGAQQAKDTYARFKIAAEEATDLIEDAYLHTSKGATEFNLKAIEALRVNVNSGFDYARELLATKSLSEAVELSASHVRKQFDTLSGQAKELSALAQKVASDASEPIKSGVSKTFKTH